MKKRVKGGKEKVYCDYCGALLYDLIPTNSGLTFCGFTIPECKIKAYQKYFSVSANSRKGRAAGIACESCYKKIDFTR